MWRIVVSVFFLSILASSWGLAQTTGSEKPTLLGDRGLQLGLQIGGFLGDNEEPREFNDSRFATFSPRVFLDYGLMNHLRGQIGAGIGAIKGRSYRSRLVPIDYRFMLIPFYSEGFSPYLTLGIGGLNYDVTRASNQLPPGVAKNGWVAYMPLGAGFVTQVSERLALEATMGWNVIFSDKVNGYLGSGNDTYWSAMIGVRFPLGKTTYDREREELQKRIAELELLKKEAELRAAEERRKSELEAQKAAEELTRRQEQAQKELEAKKAQEVPKPVEPVPPPKPEIKFEPIYFLSGGSKLGPSERAKLDAVAKTLLENPEIKVLVTGHTDNAGSRVINEKLSASRAGAVKKYLVNKGLAAERISEQGNASDEPAASNATLEGRRLNRRVELQVVK